MSIYYFVNDYKEYGQQAMVPRATGHKDNEFLLWGEILDYENKNQQWKIYKYKDSDYWYIIHAETNLAVTRYDERTEWTPASLSEFQGLDTQLFTFERQTDGSYIIKLLNSDIYLRADYRNGRIQVVLGTEKNNYINEFWHILTDPNEPSAESETGSDDSEASSAESNELANSQVQKATAMQILYTAPANMIKEVCKAIADAQRELDAQALEAQRTLEEKHKDLFDIGYRVTWYQIPEVTMELKVAVSFEQSADGSKIYFTPYNAAYKSAYNYLEEGTSNIKMRVTPVPPPIGSDENGQV